MVASRAPPTGDLVRNPGMGPDWESNWQPFGLQASTQSRAVALGFLICVTVKQSLTLPTTQGMVRTPLLSPVGLTFFICTMGIITVPASELMVKIE